MRLGKRERREARLAAGIEKARKARVALVSPDRMRTSLSSGAVRGKASRAWGFRAKTAEAIAWNRGDAKPTKAGIDAERKRLIGF